MRQSTNMASHLHTVRNLAVQPASAVMALRMYTNMSTRLSRLYRFTRPNQTQKGDITDYMIFYTVQPRYYLLLQLNWLSNCIVSVIKIEVSFLTSRRLALPSAMALLRVLKTYKRVPNSFFGIRDLAFFKAGTRDFEGKGGRDSGLQVWTGHGIWRF